MIKLFGMLAAWRRPTHFNQLGHVATPGLNMFTMFIMLADWRRPKHFKQFEHFEDFEPVLKHVQFPGYRPTTPLPRHAAVRELALVPEAAKATIPHNTANSFAKWSPPQLQQLLLPPLVPPLLAQVSISASPSNEVHPR